MKPTIKQIAEMCNVSRGTVDRVIHNRTHVDPKVREKVQKALNDSGYICAKELKKSTKPNNFTIAVLIPKWFDTYFSKNIYSGINQANHFLNDPFFKIITRELSSRSVSEYITQINELIALNVNAIIIGAPESPIIESKINELHKSGIAVITFDTDVSNSKRLCFVGQDLYKSGLIAAELMGRYMKPHDEVLIVTGYMNFDSGKMRVNGFVEGLKSQGYSSDCYSISECHEQFELSSEAVYNAIKSNSHLKYIYMANESVSGCIDGIKKAKPKSQVHVICNDLTPFAKKYLQNGQIDFVISHEFSQKIYKAIITLYNFLRYGINPKKDSIYIDSSIVTKEML